MGLVGKFGEKTVELGAAYRTREVLRGQEREIALFLIRTADISFEELHAIVADKEGLAAITTTNTVEDGNSETPVSSATFTNYIVPGEPVIAVSRQVVDQTGSNEREEVFTVKLGQLTYVEEQLQNLGISPFR